MKEKYMAPEMEIVEFENEDIITASGEGNSEDDTTSGLPFVN